MTFQLFHTSAHSMIIDALDIFGSKYEFEQKYYAPQVRPDQSSNSWPPDHDSASHVTETPAPTTRPSVNSPSQRMIRHDFDGQILISMLYAMNYIRWYILS